MKKILLALICFVGIQAETSAQYLPPPPAGYGWQVVGYCSNGCPKWGLVWCADPSAPPQYSRLTYNQSNGLWYGDRIHSAAKPQQQNQNSGGDWKPKHSEEMPKPPKEQKKEEKQPLPQEPKRAPQPPAAQPPASGT